MSSMISQAFVLLVRIRTAGHCLLASGLVFEADRQRSSDPRVSLRFPSSQSLRSNLAHHFLIPFPISSVAVCPSP